LSHTFKSLHIENPEIRELFARLEKALNEAQPEYKLYKRNAEPIRYADGDLVYADGTNWNPGAGEGLYCRVAGAWNFLEGSGGGGVGTVTSVSVVSANGFAGTVATPASTPAITLTTTITGLLKGNATAISAATAGTDYSGGTAALGTGIVKTTTGTGALTVAVAGDFPTLNQNTTGSAATLTTPRAIYGNNFDGSAALTQVIASTYGGTGNGFAKFTGPATAEKTFTLPNASATILTDNAVVTVVQGGTGNNSATWSTWTPTIAASSGTITTSSTNWARYYQIGKIVFFNVSVTITTNGTGSGALRISTPVTSSGTAVRQPVIGRNTSSGVGLIGIAQNSIGAFSVQTMAAGYPVTDGQSVEVSGTYEAN
jgi:hypothetical protein